MKDFKQSPVSTQSSGRADPGLLLPLNAEPIPVVDSASYLSAITFPGEYMSAMCRELLRNAFNGGVPLDRLDSGTVAKGLDIQSRLAEYITQIVTLRYKLSLASYVVRHPQASLAVRSDIFNLTTEMVMRMEDDVSQLPVPAKLVNLVSRMFPVIKLSTKREFLPIIPSQSEITDHYDAALSLFQDLQLQALVSNLIGKVNTFSVSVGGYPHLIGLSQGIGNEFFVQENNDITALGWPYRWGVVNLEQPVFSQIDVTNLYVRAYLPQENVSHNLAVKGRADVGAIIGGKIRAGSGQTMALHGPLPNQEATSLEFRTEAEVIASNPFPGKGKGGKP